MQLHFEGHACFQIVSQAGLTILTDPFIRGHPLCAKTPADFEPQLILISHGHDDHVGDALEIARNCGATIAAPVDLLGVLDTTGIETVAFNMGGSFEFKEAKITMVPAWHGSNYQGAYAGLACGYLIHLDGKTTYFAGDTGLFGDMRTVIGRTAIDYALLPIGDFYTMGPEDAVTAADWLQAKTVIPMHYNSFPVIQQDVQQFKNRLESRTEERCLMMQPGESHQA